MNGEDLQSGQENSSHEYLKYEESVVSPDEVRKLAAYILNRYTGLNRSVTQYRKYGEIRLTAKDQSGFETAVRFDDIVLHLSETRSFDHTVFHLTPFASNLLDGTSIQHNAPAGMNLILDSGIPNFPLSPTLGSEGIVFSSFQTPLLSNIIRLHNTIVETSHKIVDSQHLEWINDLRMLLNDCISIVDITLHQMYFRAQYAPKPHWRFDVGSLGQRQGVRIKEKLRWIGRITGNALDNAESEVKNFDVLKAIRNHLNHFDPPCVVISIDDAADWLNRVPTIGRLLWKIRSKLDSQLNRELVELILLRKVAVDPFLKTTIRIKPENGIGYSSCVW